MPKSRTHGPEGLRALLVQDHRELDQLFEALLAALQADARQEALRLWTAFDDGLSRHMALEEKELLPRLQADDPHEVDALIQEHVEIRRKLADLGVGVDLHEIRVQTVSDFIEQLRRHAQREEALAYRWAEHELPPGARDALQRGIASAQSLRRRLTQLGKKVTSGVAPTR